MPLDVRWAYDLSNLTPRGSELALKQILAGQLAQPIIIYFEAATPQFTPLANDGKADSWCPYCVQNKPELQRFISEMQRQAEEATLVSVIASFDKGDWRYIDGSPHMYSPFRRRPWNEYGNSAGLPFAVAAEKNASELFVTFLEKNPTYDNLMQLLAHAIGRVSQT